MVIRFLHHSAAWLLFCLFSKRGPPSRSHLSLQALPLYLLSLNAETCSSLWSIAPKWRSCWLLWSQPATSPTRLAAGWTPGRCTWCCFPPRNNGRRHRCRGVRCRTLTRPFASRVSTRLNCTVWPSGSGCMLLGAGCCASAWWARSCCV